MVNVHIKISNNEGRPPWQRGSINCVRTAWDTQFFLQLIRCNIIINVLFWYDHIIGCIVNGDIIGYLQELSDRHQCRVLTNSLMSSLFFLFFFFFFNSTVREWEIKFWTFLLETTNYKTLNNYLILTWWY